MRGVSDLSLSLLASQPRLSARYMFPSPIPSLVFLLRPTLEYIEEGWFLSVFCLSVRVSMTLTTAVT